MNNILGLTITGIVVGIFAGLIGSGAEILVVPLLTFLGTLGSLKERIGTSLFMILPPQLSSLLPKGYGKLMTDIDSPLIQYFPVDFKLDVMLGQKQEYSEPLLPELDEELMLEEIGKIKLTKTEERRNLILKDPIKIKV